MKRVWVVTAIAILVPVIAGLEFRRRYYSKTVLPWNPKEAGEILAALETRYVDLTRPRSNPTRVEFEYMALTGLDMSYMKNRYGHCKEYSEWLKLYTQAYHSVLSRFED